MQQLPAGNSQNTSLVLERGLPTNVEAEQFVLGSVLLDDSCWPEVAAKLRAGDFSITKHRRLFVAMGELAERSEPIEYLTMIDVLENKGQLESVDGIAYITSLTDGLPRLSNIASYLKIVSDKSRLRQLIVASEDTIAHCIDTGAGDDLVDVVGLALSRVENVLDGIEGNLQLVGPFIDETGAETLLDGSARRGIPTPFIGLDKLTGGLQRSELFTLAGRPSMGKTALALNIAAHAAAAGYKCAVFSLEMPTSVLLQRVLCGVARVDSYRFRNGYVAEDERARLKAALSVIHKWPLAIDDTGTLTVMDLRARCLRQKTRTGLDIVVIDYLQLLASHAGPGSKENRTQEVSLMTRQIKTMAKDLEVAVVLLSQLNRAPETRPGDHRPMLADLRESGAIEQDSDTVGFIFREEIYKPDREDLHGIAELILAKQRNGPTGKIKLAFISQFTKFENLAHETAEDAAPY